MISEDSLKTISSFFCGDTGTYYEYKSGPKLVSFFRQYFGVGDVYSSGFPSRWQYVFDKLVWLSHSKRVNEFFSIVLSKEYLMTERVVDEVSAAGLSKDIMCIFNDILRKDLYQIVYKKGTHLLVNIDDDLIEIGSGGFANVYKQISTGFAVKKLKDDFLTDAGIRSRFKREYNITKSLQEENGIITVYEFNEGACSYSMEFADMTLEDYVQNGCLSIDRKLECIRELLSIMSVVHKRDIVHRDLSPNNVFIINNRLKIADFGLGKDLNVITSHQTLYTNSVGQYYYCAPEQFMLLKDADKRSDVYSLGRIINFIMTGSANNSHHIYRSVAEKASYIDAAYRYGDAYQLSIAFEKAVLYQNNAESRERVESKMMRGEYDDEVCAFILEIDPPKLSELIVDKGHNITKSLLCCMQENEEHAIYIVQSIEQSFREVCWGSFSANDEFAVFAELVLRGNFSYVIKETAATILGYVAWGVNRYFAQHIVKNLIEDGIEPLLEEIIKQ